MVAIVNTPWARVKTPLDIPAGITAQQLLELDDLSFSELLRSNLYPREGQQQRSRWDMLWRILRGNDDLANRALDVLDAWDDTVDAAVGGGLTQAEAGRVAKFRTSCDQARARVDVETGSPLAWAGTRNTFPEPAQRVINRLVHAIHRHRENTGADATPADHQLWKVLRAVKLDPNDYQ